VKNCTALFIGWTNPETKQWFPVERLTWEGGKYEAVYLNGIHSAMAENPALRSFIAVLKVPLDRVEVSSSLPESFRKRMPVHRPFENVDNLRRLGLSSNLKRFDPFEYVARNGTCASNYEICAQVKPDEDGIYHFYFGDNWIPDTDIPATAYEGININDELVVVKNQIYFKNLLLGGAPSYISDLVEHHPQAVKISIQQINDCRYRFDRILCHATVDSKIAIPFADERYRPYAEALVS
jgi:hypothetical protein